MRILTAIPNGRKVARALDLGCGAEPVFRYADLAYTPVAVDIQPAKYDGIPMVACKGEAIPFADASFDLVVSRLALPYMHIPTALREIRRVLLPGGRFWATLHLPRMAVNRIKIGIRELRLAEVAYQSAAIANAALLTVTDLQIPRIHHMIESVQTPMSIARALHRAGFTDISTGIERDEVRAGVWHFAVSAFKP